MLMLDTQHSAHRSPVCHPQICDVARNSRERADAIIAAAFTAAAAVGAGAGAGSDRRHTCLSCGAGVHQFQPAQMVVDSVRQTELRKESRAALANYLAAQVGS